MKQALYGKSENTIQRAEPPIGTDPVMIDAPLSSHEMNLLMQNFNCGVYKLRFTAMPEKQATLHGLMEYMRIHGPKKGAIRPFDKGGYAQVYKIMTTAPQAVVLKVADYFDDDVFSGPFVESFMLRYLFRQFVLTGLTPHLPITLSSARSLGRKEVLNICEFAHYRSLYDFLPKTAHNITSMQSTIRLVLFQMSYTLAWIQDIHPNFRHNDTTLRNILITKAPSEGYSEYTAPDGSVYRVPNMGVRAILWDFDMATSVGLADNSRVYRFEVENTDYGISSTGQPGEDIYKLARWICVRLRSNSNFTGSNIFQELQDIWGPDDLSRELESDSPQIRLPSTDIALPTPLQLLSSPLFDIFRRPVERENITHSFGSKNLNMPFLSPDEVVEMLTVHPADLPDSFGYTVPVGFGAPEPIRELLMTFPSAQVYSKLFELYEDSVVHQCTSPVDTEPGRAELMHYTMMIADVLEDLDFPEERRHTKIEAVVCALVKVLAFLQTVQKRYAKLIVLLALFLEGEPVPTANFLEDIHSFAASQYESDTIYVGFMQYKWVKLMLQTLQ